MRQLFFTITILFSSLTCGMADESEEGRNIYLTLDMPGGLGPVAMREQPTFFTVQLPIGGGSSFEKHPSPDVKSLNLQVWLLRGDGTAIPQLEEPVRIGLANAGFDTDYLVYKFEKVPSNELAGIVVRVKGKLYSQEIRLD